MSVAVERVVVLGCDKCGAELRGAFRADTVAGAYVQARKSAAYWEGWTTVRGEDFCGACAGRPSLCRGCAIRPAAEGKLRCEHCASARRGLLDAARAMKGKGIERG